MVGAAAGCRATLSGHLPELLLPLWPPLLGGASGRAPPLYSPCRLHAGFGTVCCSSSRAGGPASWLGPALRRRQFTAVPMQPQTPTTTRTTSTATTLPLLSPPPPLLLPSASSFWLAPPGAFSHSAPAVPHPAAPSGEAAVDRLAVAAAALVVAAGGVVGVVVVVVVVAVVVVVVVADVVVVVVRVDVVVVVVAVVVVVVVVSPQLVSSRSTSASSPASKVRPASQKARLGLHSVAPLAPGLNRPGPHGVHAVSSIVFCGPLPAENRSPAGHVERLAVQALGEGGPGLNVPAAQGAQLPSVFEVAPFRKVPLLHFFWSLHSVRTPSSPWKVPAAQGAQVPSSVLPAPSRKVPLSHVFCSLHTSSWWPVASWYHPLWHAAQLPLLVVTGL